jgi:hypothetical protein
MQFNISLHFYAGDLPPPGSQLASCNMLDQLLCRPSLRSDCDRRTCVVILRCRSLTCTFRVPPAFPAESPPKHTEEQTAASACNPDRVPLRPNNPHHRRWSTTIRSRAARSPPCTAAPGRATVCRLSSVSRVTTRGRRTPADRRTRLASVTAL